MRKTKLEIYIGTLKILVQNDSLKTSKITDALNISLNEKKKCLTFLLNQGLVDKQQVDKQRIVYSISHKGIAILEYFKEKNKCSQ